MFLLFCQPAHLTYSSGQYIRLCSDSISRHDWHPFSVTSAPNHETLSVHVRVVGPWTAKLYQLYHPMHLVRRPPPEATTHDAHGKKLLTHAGAAGKGEASSPQAGALVATSIPRSVGRGAFMDSVPAGFVARGRDFYLPPLHVQGPFGGGHAGWKAYRTCVLIGAGIGITPFASILQDFSMRVQMERMAEREKERKRKKKIAQANANNGARAASSSGQAGSGMTRRHAAAQRNNADADHSNNSSASSSSSSSSSAPLFLYFIWISRSHLGYEWLLDQIREAESLDHAQGGRHRQSLQVMMYITTPTKQFDLRTAISVT